MESTQFNKYSIFIAVVALLISLAAFLTEPIISVIKGEQIDVSIERKLFPGSTLGRFFVSPFVTISNEGGKNIRLGEVSLDITFENGKKTILKADTFQMSYSNGNLPLRDVLLRSGNTWSGRVELKEQLASNEEEMNDQLYSEARKSAHVSQANHNKKALELQEKILERISQSSQPKAALLALNFADLQTPDRFDPSDEILQKARAIFEKNISQIEKGEHSATLTVSSASDKVLYKKLFRFTIYENQLSNLQASFDGYGAIYVTTREFVPLFSITLKDVK